jgi:putative CocE/NonD family hydrolase
MNRLRIVLVAVVLVAALAPASQAAPEQPLELAEVGFKLEGVPDDGAGFVVRVGDFDGDGIADLAVGAPCASTNAAAAGAVYILYGPITPDRSLADADAVLRGTWAGGFAGEFLAVLDMDGDGADELVVGVPGPFVGAGVYLEPIADSCFGFGPVQPGVNQPGEAYVVGGGQRLSGALDLDAVADTVITGLAPLDFTSFDLGGGDLNGDGHDELVVGAAGPGSAAGSGAAFLFAGDLPANTSVLDADATLIGEAPLDSFGLRIVTGDVDGDGIDDLLIAAPVQHPARPPVVSVFLGGSLPAGVVRASDADIRLVGEPGGRAGDGLVVADLDGDGFDDIIVGDRNPGVTSVFYGPLDRRGTVPLADADVTVEAGPDRFAGWAVAVANLDGDDRADADLIIGAHGDTSGGQDAGAVHRLNGELTGDVDATEQGILYVGQPGDLAGFALAAGDLTGNGVDDLVVAAPALFTAGQPGGVYIVSGTAPDGAEPGPFELAEVREVHVESHDGTLLRGWLAFPALPDGVDRAPVALHSSPYLGVCAPTAAECIPGPNTPAFWDDEPSAGVLRAWGAPPIDLVRNGYVAAFFDLRGTGGSGGCMDWGGPDEQGDQAVLVEWLAAQPWSSGRVAMGGNSYPAWTAWQAAVQAPEGLATIVTAGIVVDEYTMMHSPQGAQRTKMVEAAVRIGAGSALVPHAGADPAGDLPHIAARSTGCDHTREVGHWTSDTRLEDRDAAYWESRRLIDRLGEVRAAVLMPHGLWDVTGHGFQDVHVSALLDGAHLWQISGQWGHGPPFADTPALTPEWVHEHWHDILFDWLGYWLQGVGDTPPERVDYQDSTGAWHKAGKWPPPQARDEAVRLDGDRTFRAAPTPGNDHASASAFDVPVPPAWWAWCRQDLLPGAGLEDTAVAWVSEPFTQQRLLAGNPHADLILSSDQPGGVVEVALVRWPADASCTDLPDVVEVIAAGGADLRHHTSPYTPVPFPVDTPTPVRVDLYNTATRFFPGDRLVVVVGGTEAIGVYGSVTPYAPEINVHADSRVVVPFVPGQLGPGPTGPGPG